jgi:hypothetical protein
MIGSRFLFYRVPPLEDDKRQGGFDLVWKEDGQGDTAALRRAVQDHMEDILQHPPSLVRETPDQQMRLNELALLLARGRGLFLTERTTRLDEKTGLETYLYGLNDVQVEEPFRAVQQLRTLARALAVVHGRDRVGLRSMKSKSFGGSFSHRCCMTARKSYRCSLCMEDGYRAGTYSMNLANSLLAHING